MARFVHLFLPAHPIAALNALHAANVNQRYAFRRDAQVLTSDYQNMHRLISQDGFTHHKVKGYPDTGFVWSYRAEAHKPSTAQVWHINHIRPEHLSEHRELLERHGHLDHPNHYQGAWHDTDSGLTYLDLSHHSLDEDETRRAGLHHEQEAYYDLGKQHSIYFDKHHDAGYRAGDPAAVAKYKDIEDRYGPGVPSEYERYRHLYQ